MKSAAALAEAAPIASHMRRDAIAVLRIHSLPFFPLVPLVFPAPRRLSSIAC